LLAVIANVNADLVLLPHHLADCGIAVPCQFVCSNGFALCLPQQ
jgi:hypothetical protein